nr:helix-turn-helix domain-containing protein [Pseudomonas cichorii]
MIKQLLGKGFVTIISLLSVYRNTLAMALSSVLGVRFMQLKEALAAALRGARAHQGLGYEDLAGATHRTYVGMLEQARANPTLDKLDEIAEYLGLDLLTMVVLAVAAQGDELPTDVIRRTALKVREFEEAGGWMLVEEQFSDGKLIKRSQGKPKQPLNAESVRALKAQGLDRKTISETLGIARSTVQKYWNT